MISLVTLGSFVNPLGGTGPGGTSYVAVTMPELLTDFYLDPIVSSESLIDGPFVKAVSDSVSAPEVFTNYGDYIPKINISENNSLGSPSIRIN